jgi:hypothetical protein
VVGARVGVVIVVVVSGSRSGWLDKILPQP